MIKSTEQAIEQGIGVIARQEMTFKAPDYWQVLLQIKPDLHPTEISAHGYCHFVQK